MTLGDLIEAFMVSGGVVDVSGHGRLQFWKDELGDRLLDEVTADDVDACLTKLVRRGKLRAGRNMITVSTGKPLAKSTVSRYLGTLGGLYRYAKSERYVRLGHVPPTRGIEKPGAPINKNKFMTPEQVDNLLKWAKVVDRQWGKLPALITLAFNTGLRVGALMSIKWQDIDWDQSQVYVERTKNGDPIVSPLSPKSVAALKALNRSAPDDLVFGNRYNKPFHYRPLFAKAVQKADMPDVTFHWLRHSCGAELARSGLNQAIIMDIMGHKTLSASQRYMHSNVNSKREALSRVAAFQ